MNKLLIIEDDVTIRNALRILLENQGYFIEEAHDGEEGLQKFDSTFDLLIIDIMMPNISGIDVCRKIREKSYVPILFLTAKSLETDKMEALSAGGDDYLVKPFSYVELIARIQALIRRCRVYDNADASDTTASSTIERCGLTLDTKCNNVSYDGRQLALTDKEYQILLLLISHPTKTFSTQNKFEKVDIYFESSAGKLKIVENGKATDYSEEEATKILSQNPVTAIADVKQGDVNATAWGCDLTFDYVKINADYRS